MAVTGIWRPYIDISMSESPLVLEIDMIMMIMTMIIDAKHLIHSVYFIN